MMLPMILAATLSAGNAEFDAAAQRGACDIALRRLQAETVEKGLESGVLEKAMAGDPARFAKTNEAVRLCRALYAGALSNQYQVAAAAILQKLGMAGKTVPVAADSVARAVDARFAEAYAAERAAAVAAQARTLAGAVRPSEADFETKDEAVLRREMTARVGAEQKTPVFEENFQYISERIVDPVIADGRRELKRQRDYLSRAKSESCAPEKMAQEIEEGLRRNVAARQAKEKDPSKAWGVFPSVVRDGIPLVVRRRVTGMVVRCVDGVTVDVEAEAVLKVMMSDPPAHLRKDDSEKVFRAAYAAQILGGALDRAAREVPEKERASFVAFARRQMAEKELANAVETRLKREVLPRWREVRDDVAKQEASRLWPALVDGTWYPEAALADQLAAQANPAAAVVNWRQMPEMAQLATVNGGKTLLEETAARADKSVAAAFGLAWKAIEAQKKLVDEAEPEVLGEAKDRKSSFWRRTPDLKAIVGMLTAAVEEKWRDRRVKTLWGDGARPANADDQHVDLFPSVRKHIELVARSILEQMEKPEPEKKPEEEETPPEYSLVVRRSGDRVTVKLDQGEKTVAERNVKANLRDYQDAIRQVTDELWAKFLKDKK